MKGSFGAVARALRVHPEQPDRGPRVRRRRGRRGLHGLAHVRRPLPPQRFAGTEEPAPTARHGARRSPAGAAPAARGQGPDPGRHDRGRLRRPLRELQRDRRDPGRRGAGRDRRRRRPPRLLGSRHRRPRQRLQRGHPDRPRPPGETARPAPAAHDPLCPVERGEEQGLFGSWGYVKLHRDELGRHVMASSFDIGSGRITGFSPADGRSSPPPSTGRSSRSPSTRSTSRRCG